MSFERCKKEIAAKLRELRRERGLKQEDIARKTGISPRYYQEIEASRVNMTLYTLFRLSKAFRASVADLVCNF